MFESRLGLKGVKGFLVQWFLSGTDVSGDRGHGYSPNIPSPGQKQMEPVLPQRSQGKTKQNGTGAHPLITPGMLLGVTEGNLLQGRED